MCLFQIQSHSEQVMLFTSGIARNGRRECEPCVPRAQHVVLHACERAYERALFLCLRPARVDGCLKYSCCVYVGTRLCTFICC